MISGVRPISHVLLRLCGNKFAYSCVSRCKTSMSRMTADLRGKVAIITGASSGIGAGAAVLFAELGCNLTLCGRNVDNLRKVAEKCVEAGLDSANVHLIIGDLSKEEEAHKAINGTIDYFNKLDILVNCAGILTPGTVENTTLESYDNIMNINTRSIFLLMKLSIPHLVKTKGNIVNVSSVTGTCAFPGVIGYCMSKAALDQLTRCAALELASQGVRVNSVNPGVIITEVHKRGGMSEDAYTKFLEHSKETHALGRPGTTAEVAQAIAFLASDKTASFVTGVTLPVDGGRSIMTPR